MRNDDQPQDPLKFLRQGMGAPATDALAGFGWGGPPRR